jgi:hypothetical protein
VPQEKLSLRERIGRLIGTTRRARLLTAGTALAIVIAIVAAVALPDDEIPRDDYTVSADRICVKAKREIASARSRALADASEDPGEYPRDLVPIVAQWRADFGALEAPEDRVEEANRLDDALRAVEVGAAELAQAAERGKQDLGARAQRVDELTAEV